MSQRNESPGIINADKSIDCGSAEKNIDEELNKTHDGVKGSAPFTWLK